MKLDVWISKNCLTTLHLVELNFGQKIDSLKSCVVNTEASSNACRMTFSMSLSTVPIFFWCCLGFACFISTKIVCCELLAFRFGRQFAARAGRALFGSSTKQIRGYCQEVTSTSEIPPRNIVIAFVAGGLTSFAGLYYVFGSKLEELQAKERGLQLVWDIR
ncbi:uncharacterized protein LOC124898110 [Capsicum annuum]|uniref:uncharacterized protein LOC124898110 n=1 Tax=Capsicum annuum TaxID=4072 RepID=UPI001FB075AA|nr:uncharacterized protein LOC124898110 [Capsicum annuum]